MAGFPDSLQANGCGHTLVADQASTDNAGTGDGPKFGKLPTGGVPSPLSFFRVHFRGSSFPPPFQKLVPAWSVMQI